MTVHCWANDAGMYCGLPSSLRLVSTSLWAGVDCIACVRAGAKCEESDAIKRLAELEAAKSRSSEAFAGINYETWCNEPNRGLGGGVCSRLDGHVGDHVAHRNPTGEEFARWSGQSPSPQPVKPMASVPPSASVFKQHLDAANEALNKREQMLTRFIRFMHDAGPSELRAMDRKRDTEMRQLVREAMALIKDTAK